MKFLIILIICLGLLFGCATPYQSYGLTGGFSETQLGENIFRVSFTGNGYTTREKAIDFALLRASELCLEKGFRYFAITNDESERLPLATMISKTIVAFREKPSMDTVVYDAEFINKSIKEKYQIKD